MLLAGALAFAFSGLWSWSPVAATAAATATATPQVVTGRDHSCALSYDGTVRCWGHNPYGQLGSSTNAGTDNANPTPTVVAGIANAVQIAAGQLHTCALLADGTVSCWGINLYGQLGNATNNLSTGANPVPAVVAGVANATGITAGADHTCALLAGGTVTCWGSNYYGQLGNTTNNSIPNTANPAPAAVSGMAGATAVGAGENHTCALLAGGTVSCWGLNNYGQLGKAVNSGSNLPNPLPAVVSGVADVAGIAVGAVHTCALLAGGTVSCWGFNLRGQLGRATNAGALTPNPSAEVVGGLSGVAQVSAGALHTCARHVGGSVSCWGYNFSGQLGNATNVGNNNPNPAPLPVSGLGGVAQISVGGFHTCVRHSGGAVSCWGRNRFGQLGTTTNNGNENPNPTPAVVPGLALEPNQPPYGKMVLSLTEGRGYGMLAWAIDPETGGPVRMRVVIPGVINNEYDWNYTWADMPYYTGVNRTESLVFLARLPPGTHEVCFDALDPQGAGWVRLECHTHSVK
jgi:alpha-tubulin suppressor-like RCC1 family protein